MASTDVIVVPEGLAAGADRRRAIAAPSFAYKAVLDHVVRHFRRHRILLSPGNAFRAAKPEHEAAQDYLRERGIDNVIVPRVPAGRYIDTFGNARFLRAHLQAHGEWPLAPAILAVAARHARRAIICFERNGFALERVVAVNYEVPQDSRVVHRLFYYRYPALHALYEAAAAVRDTLRPLPREVRP